MTLRLVLDMDGVLFDSDELKATALLHVLDRRVEPAALIEIDRWNRTQRGVPRRAKFATIVERWLASTDADLADELERTYTAYLRQSLESAAPLPGVERLPTATAPLHLCSSAPIHEIRQLLTAHNLDPVFETTAGDPPGKLATLTGIVEAHPSDTVVMIGDGRADLDAARAAGADFIGVDRGSGVFDHTSVPRVPTLADALTRLGI